MSLSSLLSALQWSDTAFPSGMYTLSHGLEGLQQAGWLDRDCLAQTVSALIRDSAAPTDGRAAALAWAWAEEGADIGDIAALGAIDDVLLATKPSEFARRGSLRVGRQLTLMAEQVIHPEPGSALGRVCQAVSAKELSANQAIIAAVIHHAHGLSQVETVECELYSLAAGACSAAVRLRLADHISAQQVLHQLGGLLAQCAQDCAAAKLEDIGAFSPALDIACAQHESAPARLFIN